MTCHWKIICFATNYCHSFKMKIIYDVYLMYLNNKFHKFRKTNCKNPNLLTAKVVESEWIKLFEVYLVKYISFI